MITVFNGRDKTLTLRELHQLIEKIGLEEHGDRAVLHAGSEWEMPIHGAWMGKKGEIILDTREAKLEFVLEDDGVR